MLRGDPALKAQEPAWALGVYPIIRGQFQEDRCALRCGGRKTHSCYACCMREAVIFDTEFTAWNGSAQRNWTAPGEFREIIQIGAIGIDADTLRETSQFSVLVRPVLNPVLSDYITALTGIEQASIERDGVHLAEGVTRFLSYCGGRPMFCYGLDGWVISKNLALLGQASVWPGLRPTNIGDWFAARGFDVGALNSGSLATAAGVSFEGRAHDAVGDCRSILAAARATVARGAVNPFLG